MNNDNETTLINILNTMYNDNLRQIHNLQDSNTQIRNLLVDILSIRTPTNRNVRNTSRYTNRYGSIDTVPLRTTSQPIYTPLSTNRTYTTDNTLLNTVYLARQSAREARQNAEFMRTRNATHNTYLQQFFEPVEVYPTQPQIETATRVVLYRDIANPNNQSCPISLEPFNDNDTVSVIRYCGHIFRREELHEWFRSNCRCPVCRYDIRNYSGRSEVNIQSDVTRETTVENQSEPTPPTQTQDSEESDTLTEEISRQTQLYNITNDLSGNLLNSLTDILLNSLLNSYSGTQVDTTSPILLDIIFDTSYNPVNNPLTNTHNSQTRYYSIPYPRRNA